MSITKLDRLLTSVAWVVGIASLPVTTFPAPAVQTLAPSVLLVVDVTASVFDKLIAQSPEDPRADFRSGGSPFPPLTRDERLRLAIENHFIRALPDGARARLGFSSHRLVLTESFTADRVALSQGLRRLLVIDRAERGGPSRIWDNAVSAIRALGSESGRRELVFITDGQATGNRLQAVDVIEAAQANRVTVHLISLALDRELRQAEGESIILRPNAALRRIAQETGGEFISPGGDKIYLQGYEDDPPSKHQLWQLYSPDPGKALQRVMERIRSTR